MPASLVDVALSPLIQQLGEARGQTDALFSIVKTDSLYERPIAERHRIVFYIGHLEAFDWNLLHDRVLGLESFRPDFDRLFAFGIDPVDGGLPSDQPSQWPSIADVRDYVRTARNVLDDKLQTALDSDNTGRDGFSLDTLIHVAIEHRLMHAETLAYMLHQMQFDHKIKQAESFQSDITPPDHRSIDIPAGRVTLGLARQGGSFGWDNEFARHTVNVPSFAIDRYKVTNRQFLDFMEAGGYENSRLWSDEDWKWKLDRGICCPAFWKRDGNRWMYRTMFEKMPLPPEWPVYVSQAEAKAYAKWAARFLPTEAEWQRAAYATAGGEERSYPWGNSVPSHELGNFDFFRWNPVPVNAFPAGRSAFGVDGMVGNGWEWTSTAFNPYPGFEPFPFYRGYSADFFDGRHFVMKGGSARTAACMLRPTFRNWFQPHYQYMYTGFRCVSR
ncbi:MAG TPA: SUMF1/EgtB/PvdO family nonheme iron enzyme [Candidatus Sulfotelmatobacter sp.]|jgi:ergothioneine biosynthesis protein EgtB